MMSSPQQKDGSTLLNEGIAKEAVREGTVDLEILGAISDFQSPKAVISKDALDPHTDIKERVTKKNNNACYIHNLSKKVSSISTRNVPGNTAKNARKKSAALSLTDSKPLAVGRGRTSDGGISAKMSPRSGRVIVDASKRKSTSSGASDGSDVADDSDGLENTMSDEEDGDF